MLGVKVNSGLWKQQQETTLSRCSGVFDLLKPTWLKSLQRLFKIWKFTIP